MYIKKVELRGFRNYKKANINFCEKTLVIGANDVGKSNLIRALRILLDKSLSDFEISPLESDFHVSREGIQIGMYSILITLAGVTEDAVLSRLKGWVSNDGEVLIGIKANLSELSYQLYIGQSRATIEAIDGRSYLKYIHFKFVQSYRDISQIIKTEKKNLIRAAKSDRTDEIAEMDTAKESEISGHIGNINQAVSELSYISNATEQLNSEIDRTPIYRPVCNGQLSLTL